MVRYFLVSNYRDWIKNQKLLIENNPLKKWMKEMAEKRQTDAVVQPAPITNELQGLVNEKENFTGKIPEEHFFDKYDDSKFMEIMEEQMTLIKALKNMISQNI